MVRIIKIGLLGIFSIAIIVIGYICLQPATFPFRQINVVVDGQYIPADNLLTNIKSKLQGGFFSLDGQQIKSTLQAMAWVDSVDLRRIWPATLLITVHEHYPVARWNQVKVITANAALIQPPLDTISDALPRLYGPDEQWPEVYRYYKIFNLELSQLGLFVKQLHLRSSGGWQLSLTNGVTIELGDQDVLVRMMRFVEIYSNLVTQSHKKLSYVDLRYPDGLAVKWRVTH